MKIIKKIGWSFLTVAYVFLLASAFVPVAFGAGTLGPDGYTPLAAIPGTGEGGCDVTKGADVDPKTCKIQKLDTYLAGAYRVGVAAAGILAVLMLVWGGFKYASTDSITGKEDGKNNMKNALFGLTLAAGSYVILSFINPKLVNLNLNFGGALGQRSLGEAVFVNSLASQQLYIDKLGAIKDNLLNARISAETAREQAKKIKDDNETFLNQYKMGSLTGEAKASAEDLIRAVSAFEKESETIISLKSGEATIDMAVANAGADIKYAGTNAASQIKDGVTKSIQELSNISADPEKIAGLKIKANSAIIEQCKKLVKANSGTVITSNLIILDATGTGLTGSTPGITASGDFSQASACLASFKIN